MEDQLKRKAQKIAKEFELFVLDAIDQKIYENFEDDAAFLAGCLETFLDQLDEAINA